MSRKQRKTSKKNLQEELSIEAAFIRRIWQLAEQYADKLNKHEPDQAKKLIHREQDKYLLLLNAAVNFQLGLEKKGIPFPDGANRYTSKMKEFQGCKPIGKGGNINPECVKCVRCDFTSQDEIGKYCTQFYAGPKRQRYYVSADDGCMRGVLRDEYR